MLTHEFIFERIEILSFAQLDFSNSKWTDAIKMKGMNTC